MTAPLDVRDGDVVRYHPITTSANHVRVRIDGEPWMLGNGERICRAIGVDDGKVYRPWVEALTLDHGVPEAPKGITSTHRRPRKREVG